MRLRHLAEMALRRADLLQRQLRFRFTASRLNPLGPAVLERNVLANKRVILIGPANTVSDDLQGLDVDTFDIIVRLNNGIQLARENPALLGSRTDILIHNMNETGPRSAGEIPASLLLLHRVRYCVFPHWGFKGSKARFFKKRAELASLPQIETAVFPRAFCEKVRRDLGDHQPTIGTSAILFLLTCKVKELQIQGFTFFQTAYVPGYNDEVVTPEDARKWVAASAVHDPAQEKRLIRDRLSEARGQGRNVVLGRNVSRYLSTDA